MQQPQDAPQAFSKAWNSHDMTAFGSLFDALAQSAGKRDVKISRATHLMHLETMRVALWKESITFLAGEAGTDR